MSFMDGKPIEGSLEVTEESTEVLKKLYAIPDDIRKKAADVYNYMVRSYCRRMVFQFESGTKFIMEIDCSEWKNIPIRELEEVLKGGTNESNRTDLEV